jgi:hypothetical protein
MTLASPVHGENCESLPAKYVGRRLSMSLRYCDSFDLLTALDFAARTPARGRGLRGELPLSELAHDFGWPRSPVIPRQGRLHDSRARCSLAATLGEPTITLDSSHFEPVSKPRPHGNRGPQHDQQ